MRFSTADGFERKLDQVQQEMGIPMSHRVSVSYVHRIGLFV